MPKTLVAPKERTIEAVSADLEALTQEGRQLDERYAELERRSYADHGVHGEMLSIDYRRQGIPGRRGELEAELHRAKQREVLSRYRETLLYYGNTVIRQSKAERAKAEADEQQRQAAAELDSATITRGSVAQTLQQAEYEARRLNVTPDELLAIVAETRAATVQFEWWVTGQTE